MDDDESFRYNLEIALSFNGFLIKSCKSSETAFKTLSQSKIIPSIILSDIVMPKSDGFYFLQQIKKNLKWSKIPFVFISAFFSKEIVKKTRQIGADEFLLKPFIIEDLINFIKSLVIPCFENQSL